MVAPIMLASGVSLAKVSILVEERVIWHLFEHVWDAQSSGGTADSMASALVGGLSPRAGHRIYMRPNVPQTYFLPAVWRVNR